jgi:hypothetical protein
MGNAGEDAEVLEDIRKGVVWEEEFVLKYDGGAVWSLLQSLGPDKAGRIGKLLRENLADTRRHYGLLKGILESGGGGHG